MPFKKDFEIDDVVYSSLESTKAKDTKSFQMSWGVNQFGFGQFYFYTDDNGIIHVDTETLKRETMIKIMNKFINDIVFENGRKEDISSLADLEIIAIEKGEDDWKMVCSNTTEEKAKAFLFKMIENCVID